jgi:regulatory protein
MKITDISGQVRNPDRVNISVDGKYRFSLDIFQVGELCVKIGKEYTDAELSELQTESQFSKLYSRALEYCLMRPHSTKEVRDYLWRKTRTTKSRNKRTGEIYEREGVSQSNADRVLDRLIQKGYIDDEKFTRFWVENRNLKKGTSARKLTAELRSKGVEQHIITEVIGDSVRTDETELQKVIAKKRARYTDDQKLIQYLARQGFSYDDIRTALNELEDS